jgi:hypothetical protein
MISRLKCRFRAVTWMGWLVIAAMAAAGCGGGGEEERLQRGVRFAKITLERAGTDPMASLALASAEETGGDAVSYIVASLPDQDPVFTSYERERPTRPWTVVVRAGAAPRQYVIEGYGTDLAKPLVTETVAVGKLEEIGE